MAAFKDSGCSSWYKTTDNGVSYVQDEDVIKHFKSVETSSRGWLGHNRAATLGLVTADNAHPFKAGEDDEVVMMHNGTVWNHEQLTGGSQFEVDSEAICNSIYEDGIEETVDTLFGAWALVWLDSRDNTLNFCRNDDRPLWFAKISKAYKNDKRNRWAYASEKDMLKWILGRNNIDVDTYFQLNPRKHMKFSLDGDFSKAECSDLTHSVDDIPTSTTYPNYPSYKTRHHAAASGGGAVIDYASGLKKGDDVDFCPTELVPHKDQSSTAEGMVIGDLYGYMMDRPYLDVRVWGIVEKASSMERSVNGVSYYLPYGTYSGKVMTTFNHRVDGVSVKTLVLNKTSLCYFPDVLPDTKEEQPAKQAPKSSPPQLTYDRKYPDKCMGPEGLLISTEEFMHLTEQGCSVCDDDLNVADATDMAWDGPDMPVCPSCAFYLGMDTEHPNVTQMVH